jgi:hypothetical protein
MIWTRTFGAEEPLVDFRISLWQKEMDNRGSRPLFIEIVTFRHGSTFDQENLSHAKRATSERSVR